MTAAVVGASASLVACGGSEEDGGDEAEASFEDAQVEFAACMRENGVDFPDPEPGQGGMQFRAGDPDAPDLDDPAFQEASEECGSIIEDSIPEGDRPDPAEIQDRAHEMSECMRDRGYDVPEPQIRVLGSESENEGPPPEEDLERLEELQDDPEFQQAQEECSEEAGLGEGGPIAGGPGAGGEN